MKKDTYYAFTPTESGVYVADPNPLKVACWCGCEETSWTRDKDTGHYGHYMEAGKTYYIKPVSDDVRISLKRNVTILDYDYYQAFIASGGAVSADGTITEGNAGWSLKSAVYALFDFIRSGIADLSKFARGNQYWKTDSEGSFQAGKIYTISEPNTPVEADGIKDGDVLLVEYRPQTVWVQSINLTADKTSLKAGESVQVQAQLDKGQEKYDFVTAPVLRWESSDDTIASVDGNGKVTANKAGSAVITVYADEDLRKQEGLKDIVKETLEISVAEGQSGDPGHTTPTAIQLGQEVVLADGPWTYEFTPAEDGVYYLSSEQGSLSAEWRKASDNTELQPAEGKYTLKANEKYLVAVKTGTKGGYAGTAYTLAFKINKAKLDERNLVYAPVCPKGKAYMPAVVKDNILLKAKTDYTITYYDENDPQKPLKKAPTKEGKYQMRIQGKGSCEGDFSVAYAVVVAAEDGKTSIAKAGIKPEVTVRVGGEKLAMGVDYTVSYKNIKKIGKEATVTIKGKGNYCKKVSRKFKVTNE